MAPPTGVKRPAEVVERIKKAIHASRADPLKWGGDRRPENAAHYRHTAFLAKLGTPANYNADPETQSRIDRVLTRNSVRLSHPLPPLRKGLKA